MSHFQSFSSFTKSLIFFVIINGINADYYSSVTGLENLFVMEENYITAVEDYIEDVQKVQQKIESFLKEIDAEHQKINNSRINYYGDPINAFSIIKRLVIDWKRYDGLFEMEPQINAFKTKFSELGARYNKPSEDDLQGAARGLMRLQKMYQIDTTELAKGYIYGRKYSNELKAHDCFIMGESLFNSSAYVQASEWFLEAMQKVEIENIEKDENALNDFPQISLEIILEYLQMSLFFGDNFKLAKIINQQLLLMDPENEVALERKQLFEEAVKEERRSSYAIYKKPQKSELDTLYAQVCSGELSRTPAELRPLRCRYATNNIPYYFIGPFKVEELSHDPFVAFYHQAIHNGEIEQIHQAVENNTVVRSKVGLNIMSEIRTSKQTWLYWEKHNFLDIIYQRLEDITGLSMKTAEAMQVANYGIGGHYGPHYDFADTPMEFFGSFENRMLTAMFYINDVELGGATAFPFLRLAVPPIKNSLVVWYNMHESSELDYRTKHAGCPVLKGSKWICNEWFHDVGQEFKRPCGLQPKGDKYNYLNLIA